MDAVVGYIIALTLSMLGVVGFEGWAKIGVQNVQTAAAASQLLVFDKAASQYVQDNASVLASTATSAVPVTVTPAMLVTAGYLPGGFSGTNPFGQTWQLQVLQPTSGHLQSLVTSQGGRAISNVTQLLQIAAQAGAQGGFVPYANQSGDATMSPANAYGAFGAWKISLANYANPGAGHIASLLAFTGAQANSSYLYRVAVPGQPQLNAMQTDLSMTDVGGTAHNITGANQISAQSLVALSDGGLGTPSVSMANGHVLAWNNVPEGGVLQLVDKSGTNVFVEAFNGMFRLVNSPFNAQLFSVDQSGNVVAAGDISTPQQIHAMGTTRASCPAGWGCGVTTWDMYANGSVGVGPAGGPISAQINNNGNISTISTILPGAVATLGGACSPNGLIAASANGSGQLLSCQAGVWVAAGLPVGVFGNACSVPGQLGQDSGGTGLVCQGGVWDAVQHRTGAWALMGSYYAQNGWWVQKPTCITNSVPRILVTFGGTNTVNNSGTVNQSATDLGNGYWRVNLLDGYGNGLPGYTLAQTYCAYD